MPLAQITQPPSTLFTQVPQVPASTAISQPQDHTDLGVLRAIAGGLGGALAILLCLIVFLFNRQRLARLRNTRLRARTSHVSDTPATSPDTRQFSTSLLAPIAVGTPTGSSLISTFRESSVPSEALQERQSLSGNIYHSVDGWGDTSDVEAGHEEETGYKDEEEESNDSRRSLSHQRPASPQAPTPVERGRDPSVVGGASLGGLSGVSGLTDAPPPYTSAKAPVFDLNELEQARLAIERYNSSPVHL